MSEKKIAVYSGAPICATEVNAIIARMNIEKVKKRNKSDRERNKADRWK